MFNTIELFAGAGGLALGIEKAGFNTLGLIEFNRDACDTLQKNRPNWRVICEDIADISKLDLEEYFGIKKGELDLLSGVRLAKHFRMPVRDSVLKMQEELSFTIMLFSLKNFNQKCFCLKMFADYLHMMVVKLIKQC